MNTKKYSNSQILARVREHCIDDMKSVHSMHDPTYAGIKKRCDVDASLKSKVDSLIAEANAKWESLGIEALVNRDKDFNTVLYRVLIANKKPFLPYETLEIEDRITALEERANEPQN